MASLNSNRDQDIKLAIVGHSNTGKTSLLRTLLRNYKFGEVANESGTTRHVEGVRLHIDKSSAIHWYDTPGLEDSIALLEYIEQLKDQSDTRLDGPDSIVRFLDTPESQRRFEQEARVLRQLLACEAGLYVVDAREPVQSRHKDELDVLSRCGKPLIPVLNFLHSPDNYVEAWKNTFSRQGLHVVIEFDSVAPALDGEEILYRKLALVLESHKDNFLALADHTAQQRQTRRENACSLVAELIVDIAAFRRQVDDDETLIRECWTKMQDQVREAEQALVQELLELYRFPKDLYSDAELIETDSRLGMDLFNTEAMKDMGIHLGKGFAAGAMAGAGIDLLTGGLSLGAATLIGGVAGGLWQGGEKWGRRILGKIQGYRELTVDDSVLRMSGVKGLTLIDALEKRGHAAQNPIAAINTQDISITQDSLPGAIKQARAHPEWSHLNPGFKDRADRREAVQDISDYLQKSPESNTD